ncbi:MAG: hypothetical protein ACFFAO_21145, partial [Candidatus Hermodarchaeota archaeon]
IEIPEFNKSNFKIYNENPKINKKFQLFGVYPEFHCILKSDKLLKEINSLIERQLKIYSWKAIKYYNHEEIIRKNIERDVFNQLYENCSEYIDFINKYHIELSIYIKNIIEKHCSKEDQIVKVPLNLLSLQNREKYEYYLGRKLLLT